MLSNYSNIVEVGQGGFGCVYRAIDNLTGQPVAIKMMSNKVAYQPMYRQLFETEVMTLKSLNHPNIVHILGNPFSDTQGNLYLPMEFIEGETIKQRVSRVGPYKEQDATELMIKVLDAMQYVYQQGKIHRDIKPSNIMIRPDGSVCIIDFGIAKDTKMSTGMTVGNVIGTDGYMSPEQADGNNIDHRTDIYSLGCTFYYLMTGHDAIAKRTNDVETRIAVMEQKVPDITIEHPEISRYTADVIAKATDKNMLLRYQTPNAFKLALELKNAPVNPTAATSKTEITIGSREDNDIIILNQYVSRHHCTIAISEDMYGGEKTIIFTDTSTNGTGIEGRFIKKASERIPLADNADVMPQILLAGRAETVLNWMQIDEVYKRKTDRSLFDKSVSPPPPKRKDEDKLSFGWWLLIMVIPLVGILEYHPWKKETPKKARTALILGIVMLIVNNIIYFLFKNNL